MSVRTWLKEIRKRAKRSHAKCRGDNLSCPWSPLGGVV